MLQLFSIRVAECAAFLGKSFLSVRRVCFSRTFTNFCVCPSFRLGFKSRVEDLIVLVSDHCLPIYFS